MARHKKRMLYVLAATLIIAAALVTLAYLYTKAPFGTGPLPLWVYFGKGTIDLNGTAHPVWVANTLQLELAGMMYRRSFQGAYGMVFYFGNQSQNQSEACMWMKGTILPLEQVWINNSGYVTNIYYGKPYSTVTVCYGATYVLEANPNASIKLGSRILVTPS